MSQSIFEQIKNTLNEIQHGNKYLISMMEKLKKDVPDLAPMMSQMGEGIKGLEAFVGISRQMGTKIDSIQGGISNINNMALAMENLKGEIQTINNNYLSYKPILVGIKQSSERQEQALLSLNQNIQQLGSLMGNILAKLG